MRTDTAVLVTGATGFIGSALVSKLVSQGMRVACLARAQGKEALTGAARGARWIQRDRHDPQTLRRLLFDFSPEVVFNLASYGVKPDDRDVAAMIDGNIALLTDVLQAVSDRPPRRFIHVGSCAEFGAVSAGERLSERHPIDPTSLYGSTKAAAAMIGRCVAQQLNIPLTTLRLFGVYGCGEASYRLIPYLIDQLRQDQRVDLTAGEQQRDMTYIDDVVDALIVAAESVGIADSASYNVCSGVPVRIRDIASTVCRLLEKPPNLLALGARPYRQDESMFIVGDPRLFHVATGWSPRVSLEEGIGRMMAQCVADEARVSLEQP